MRRSSPLFISNDPATPWIYTLSLHDALPICLADRRAERRVGVVVDQRIDMAVTFQRKLDQGRGLDGRQRMRDRKSTRLNSSHMSISYAVFCLKKKKTN